jgi:serine/threonine-protein kinase
LLDKNDYCDKIYFPAFFIRNFSGMKSKNIDIKEGDVIDGKFLALRKIGEGGMGIVWLSQDINLEREVALKILRPGEMTDPVAFKRFEREARIVSRLRHPNTVVIHSYGTLFGNNPYYVMEYIKGKDMESLLEDVIRLPLDRMIAIISQVLDSLSEAHSLGIVHRDLKPGNILLTELAGKKEFVKVVDFGLAKSFREDSDFHEMKATAGKIIIGTPLFMSPEQIELKKVDQRSDIYAVGMILYTALSGEFPFGGGSLTQLFNDILNVKPRSLREIKPELQIPEHIDNVILKSLEKNPDNRFQDVEEFSVALVRAYNADTAPVSVFATQECPHCKKESGKEFHFCTHCGHTLSVEEGFDEVKDRAMFESAAGGIKQIRTLTVLSLKLTGIKDFEEEAGFEDSKDIIDRCMDLIIKYFAGKDGTVLQHYGDHALIAFGLRKSTEEDSGKAVNAAYEFISHMPQLKAELGLPKNSTLSAKIGIETGRVLLKINERQKTGEVLGQCAELSKSLSLIAPPGTILTGPNTYKFIRGLYDVDIQAMDNIPEIEGRKSIARIVKKRGTGYSLASNFRGLEIQMVGRDMELQILKMVLERSIAGRQLQIVTINGPGGSGKSRLVREFLKSIEEMCDKMWIEVSQCFQDAYRTPYDLFVSNTRNRAQIEETDNPQNMEKKIENHLREIFEKETEIGLDAKKIGHLVALMMGTNIPGSEVIAQFKDNPKDLKQNLLIALVMLYRAMLKQFPILMVIDDFQWASPETNEILRHLMKALLNEPILIVLCIRSETTQKLASLDEFNEVLTRIPVRNLSEDVTRMLIRHMLRKVKRMPDYLPAKIYEMSGGNPYFIEEIINHLIDNNKIEIIGDDIWELKIKNPGEIELPVTIDAVIQARIDQLTAPEKDLIYKAGIIGKKFWKSVLALMDTGNCGEILENLCLKGFFVRSHLSSIAGEEEYAFKSVMIHDIVHKHVLKSVRMKYHRIVAEWFERIGANRMEEFYELAAYHYNQSGKYETALDYYFKSAAKAERLYAGDDVISHYTRCAEILKTSKIHGADNHENEIHLVKVLCRLGNALRVASRYHEGMVNLKEGLKLVESFSGIADRESVFDLKIDVYLCLGRIFEDQGIFQEALEKYKQALEFCHENKIVSLWIMPLMIRIAAVNQRQGNYSRAIAELTQVASEMNGKPESGSVQMADLHNVLGNAHSFMGHYKDAEKHYLISQGIYKERGNLIGTANLLNNLGSLSYMTGQYEESEKYYKEAMSFYEKFGDEYGRAMVMSNLGEVAFRKNNISMAVEYLNRSERISRDIGTKDLLPDTYRLMGEIFLSSGKLDEAYSISLKALSMAHETGNQYYIGSSQKVLARIYIKKHDKDRQPDSLNMVREYYKKSIQTFESSEQTGKLKETLKEYVGFLKSAGVDHADVQAMLDQIEKS